MSLFDLQGLGFSSDVEPLARGFSTVGCRHTCTSGNWGCWSTWSTGSCTPVCS